MKYCLDSNIFIEAWNKHYAPHFAPEYWEILDQLAQEGVIFAPEEVKRELVRVEDALNQWVEARPHLFHKIDDAVQECVIEIFQTEKNQRLIQEGTSRSAADPWVVAHAMAENAVVVTKETYEDKSPKKVRIPNVCESMGVEWIDEFEFLKRVGIRFMATLNR
ncbi:MAG: DUF4411 family protein [Magnetococcales bacterium]|nr:DUF4411 family protein [Magnetococcales bacterium]